MCERLVNLLPLPYKITIRDIADELTLVLAVFSRTIANQLPLDAATKPFIAAIAKRSGCRYKMTPAFKTGRSLCNRCDHTQPPFISPIILEPIPFCGESPRPNATDSFVLAYDKFFNHFSNIKYPQYEKIVQTTA